MINKAPHSSFKSRHIIAVLIKNLIITLSAITLFSCTYASSRASESQPIWLKNKISQFESERVSNPPRQIYKTTYQGKTVYYIPPICCDIYSDLYNASGNLICHPDGGITGRGDQRCTDFINTPDSKKILWQDKRQ
jgi:hypothetical protein